MVVSEIVSVPSLKSAPPEDVAELPENLAPLMVMMLDAPPRMAPPFPFALLLTKVVSVALSVPLRR